MIQKYQINQSIVKYDCLNELVLYIYFENNVKLIKLSADMWIRIRLDPHSFESKDPDPGVRNKGKIYLNL